MGDVEVTATVHAETSLSPSRTPLEEVDGAHSDGDKESDETKLSDSSDKRASTSSSSSSSENNFNPEAHEFVPKPEDSADELVGDPPSISHVIASPVHVVDVVSAADGGLGTILHPFHLSLLRHGL